MLIEKKNITKRKKQASENDKIFFYSDEPDKLLQKPNSIEIQLCVRCTPRQYDECIAKKEHLQFLDGRKH